MGQGFETEATGLSFALLLVWDLGRSLKESYFVDNTKHVIRSRIRVKT